MVSTGDWIILDGKTVQVTARWAAGKHVKYTLSDGRVMHDLHKRADVQIASQEIKEERKQSWYTELETLGTVEDLRDQTPNGEDLLD